MARPRRLDQRPEHAGDEGVSAQEQRERSRLGGRGEGAQLAIGERVRAEEIRREAFLRVRMPAEMSEQHARVEQHPVAELTEALEERFPSDLSVKEAEDRARFARGITAGGLHAAL